MIEPYRMIAVNTILSIALILSLFFYRFVYPKKHLNLFVLLILISILPIVSILRIGTYESGDLTLHSVFLQSFYKSLEEGIIFPQWSGGLCAGYGCPVFIFEYNLPFYIGSVFHFLGFTYIDSIKLLLIFSYISSGITMYLWGKDEFGSVPGFVASIFYLFAPYHLLDMHFRVSVGEVLSFAPIPLLFLFAKKIIESGKTVYFLLGTISTSLLILSHTSTFQAIFPIVFLYGLFVWFRQKEKLISRFLLFLFSTILGLFLTAYFWLPALSEVMYTWYSQNIPTGGYKAIWEYLYSPTLYGFLFQGHNGEHRLIIGYPHLLMVMAGIFLLWKRKIDSHYRLFLLAFTFLFFALFFIMTEYADPIWKTVPLINNFALAWRLLVPIAFVTSLVAAVVVRSIRSNTLILTLCAITIFSTILNWGNRRMVPEDPNAFYTHWSLYTEYFEDGNPQYEEIYRNKAQLAPELVLKRPNVPLEVLKGNAEVNVLNRSSLSHSYLINARSNIALKENTFYFPGWTVMANYKKIPIAYDNPSHMGIITFTLPKGLYKVDVRFEDTTVRWKGEMITYMTAVFLGIISTVSLLKTYSVRPFRLQRRR